MRWLGLTGGLGTGKSTVSEMLRKARVPVVDADRIAKEVVERNSPGLAQVVQAFGPGGSEESTAMAVRSKSCLGSLRRAAAFRKKSASSV